MQIARDGIGRGRRSGRVGGRPLSCVLSVWMQWATRARSRRSGAGTRLIAPRRSPTRWAGSSTGTRASMSALPSASSGIASDGRLRAVGCARAKRCRSTGTASSRSARQPGSSPPPCSRRWSSRDFFDSTTRYSVIFPRTYACRYAAGRSRSATSRPRRAACRVCHQGRSDDRWVGAMTLRGL
jgi:hypothetical protein